MSPESTHFIVAVYG